MREDMNKFVAKVRPTLPPFVIRWRTQVRTGGASPGRRRRESEREPSPTLRMGGVHCFILTAMRARMNDEIISDADAL
jgi:hypothetical protein